MEGHGEIREAARQAWWSQKDADRACDAMAQSLLAAGVLTQEDVWRKLRLSVELDRPALVQQSSRLLGDVISVAIARLMSQPQAFLAPTMDGAGQPIGGAAESGLRQPPGASIGPRGASNKKVKSKGKNKAAKKQAQLDTHSHGDPC